MRTTSSSTNALPLSAMASWPRPVRNAAALAAAVSSTSVTATRAPSRARKCAIVPPMLGPAPKTIATLPSRRFMSCHRLGAIALGRHCFGVFEPAPGFGGVAGAQRLHLAPEDLTQQHDAGVGFAEQYLRSEEHTSELQSL